MKFFVASLIFATSTINDTVNDQCIKPISLLALGVLSLNLLRHRCARKLGLEPETVI